MSQLWSIVERLVNRVSEPVRVEALHQLRRQFLAAEIAPGYLEDPRILAAYEWFFFPQSFAKAESVLAELGAFAASEILDLGSAMGPLGFAGLTRHRQARLHLVDTSGKALADGATIGKALGAKVETLAADFTQAWPTVPAPDLLLVGNALSETEHGAALVHEWLEQRVQPGGYVVIIEPADRPHARRLQALRDELLGFGLAPVAPCPHRAPCPASIRPRDFCHQARTLALPEFFAAARATAGLTDERQRFSYLIYRRQSAVSETAASDLVRIISHPIKEKGRRRFFGCHQSGLIELMRQDRLKSEANGAFDRLGRGALVRLAHVEPVTKILAEEGVELVGPADPWAAND